MVWSRKVEIKETPRGVTIKKNKKSETIQISFMYKGIRCRELLKNLPVTKSNINFANRKLAEIINNIERGTFNYADYFPDSNKLKVFGSAYSGSTVKDYLDKYIIQCEKRELSPSTIRGYRKDISSLKQLHDVYVIDLNPAIIKNWVEQQNTKIKTVRNRYSLLKSALNEAVIDGLLAYNPVNNVSTARYHNNTSTSPDYIVDPFSPNEIEKILSCCSNEQWKNLFQFNFETGMRPSELCSAKWSNLNLDKKIYFVDSARVVKVEKGTKTIAGTREIELTPKAMEALNKQKKFTYMHSEYIFHDPKTNKNWDDADVIRKKAWVTTLKKAGINYRNPYQMRHTFATRHISQGVNLFWLAKQMGHKGPEMLYRHYGRYLKDYEGNTSIPKQLNE